MNATEALRSAQAAGVEIRLDGDDLVLTASDQPPAAVLDGLRRHKADLVALLRADRCGWSVEDWRTYFAERAGIAEFDAGLSRTEAEARAFDCCVAEWLNRNSIGSSPGHCVSCGGGEQAHDPLLPLGTESTGHAWLHGRCWNAWHVGRRARAVDALTAMGIQVGSSLP